VRAVAARRRRGGAGRYDGRGEVGAWIWGISVRRLVDAVRRSPRPAASLLDVPEAVEVVGSAEEQVPAAVTAHRARRRPARDHGRPADERPGVALLVMIAMVAVNVWLNNRPETLQPLATFVPWPRWVSGEHAWAGFHPGSPAWHVAYLASLCAMAATGAFLREARDRFRVLCVGGLCTTAAVVTGILQLP
jgi:hypothetical protein